MYVVTKSAFFILTVFLVIANVGCKNHENACKIDGKWYFHQVNRNYKPTNTLEGGYFEFLPSNKFKSNIFGDLSEYAYKFTGEAIEITTDEKLKFTVIECNTDTLILAGEISAFYMNFLMTRKPAESHQESKESVDEDLQ
jgi:hypothetical protein